MQARAMVDKYIFYVCVATTCLYVHFYLPGIRVITILPHVLPPKFR